jgi:hypothetical protein
LCSENVTTKTIIFNKKPLLKVAGFFLKISSGVAKYSFDTLANNALFKRDLGRKLGLNLAVWRLAING